MTAFEIIAKKRDGKKLSKEEIEYFIHGYAQGRIPDYQMAALLMAIYLRGMDFDETANLTRSMLLSGDIINFQDFPDPKIDKHSTGGVGDKVSLILAPLVAAAGIKVPMISGRGLAHSGGTLDKLESIPGFRTDLSIDEFYQQVKEIGVAMIGQTSRIVPADKKMYALRDSTATVDSIPLITGSILSKKLAEGINGLVLDVKTGKGAFMRSFQDAEKLAHSLVQTAKLSGLTTTALITNMDQPLGYAVGNWLETREAIMALKGHGPDDLMTITLALGAQMLLMAKMEQDYEAALNKLEHLLETGIAFNKFVSMLEGQGGDTTYLYNPGKYSLPKFKQQLRSPATGFINEVDALKIGTAVVKLGGGREVMEDRIDYGAGIILNKKIGDRVTKGDLLALLYTERSKTVNEALQLVKSAFKISKSPPPNYNLILKIIPQGIY